MVSHRFIRSSLKECTLNRDLGLCHKLHLATVDQGLDGITSLPNHLIFVYSSCGALEDANYVFRNISNPSTQVCNAIVTGYIKVGQASMAIGIFNQMHENGTSLDRITLLCMLKTFCITKDFASGRLMHDLAVENGLELDTVTGNAIASMYSKCAKLEDAQRMFDLIPVKDVNSWCTLIDGYALHGNDLHALKMFEEMQQSVVEPNSLTFLAVLKSCCNIRSICLTQRIHDRIIRSNTNGDILTMSSLINTYAKCGALPEAQCLFDRLPRQNAVSWGAMITGYVENGQDQLAFQLFRNMIEIGLHPTRATFLAASKICSNLQLCKEGMMTHHCVVNDSLESDVIVASSLVDMHAKCGGLMDACKIFQKIPYLDIVSWGVMIEGYADNGKGDLALTLFEKMLRTGIQSNKPIFLSTLKACGCERALKSGRIIHNDIIRSTVEIDSTINTSLIDMYVKCGSLEDARRMFDTMQERTVVTWSALISGYAEHGGAESAFELFENMKFNGINPDKISFSAILKACASLNVIGHGRKVHDEIRKIGLQSDVVVGTALIDMYNKCGYVEEARNAFDEMPIRNTLSWGAMIAGYAQHHYGFSAFELFKEMQEKGIIPNRVTFLCILKACSSLGSIVYGHWVHAQIICNGHECDAMISNTLVDMYVKCGGLRESHKVFCDIKDPDAVSWAVMVTGYAHHGMYDMAMNCIEVMFRQGLMPNDAIFASLLAACSHAGVIGEGCHFFNHLREEHDMSPGLEQYSCLVDLFGRGGQLDQADDLQRTMPLIPNYIVHMSFLTHCRNFKIMDMKNKVRDPAQNLDIVH